MTIPRLPLPAHIECSLVISESWHKTHTGMDIYSRQGLTRGESFLFTLTSHSLLKEAICNHIPLDLQKGGASALRGDPREKNMRRHTIASEICVAIRQTTYRDMGSIPLLPTCSPHYEQSGTGSVSNRRLEVGHSVRTSITLATI
jgi:hypothetical protein